MSILLPAARLRSLLSAYLLAVALITITFAVLNARVAHPWIIAEWLINYRAGFIRRGLLGALLLATHEVTRLPLVALAAALQVTLYLAFYGSILPLLRGVRWSLPLLALLLSPATLAFTVLDPPTSVRKEILLYLALSLLVNASLSLRRRPRMRAIAVAVAAPLLVLVHEGLIVFLPYLFLPLLLSPGSLRRALRLVAVPVLLSGLALAGALTHRGNVAQAQVICASIGGHLDHQPGGLCNGAVAYLELTPAEARAETLRAIRFYHYRTRYPLPILLTLVPVAALFFRRFRRRDDPRVTRLLLGITLLSFGLSVPLFVIARDWGRWASLHATCLLLLFLLLERSPRGAPAENDPLPHTSGLMLTPPRCAALLLYATCWTLPAVGIFPGRFGYVDLVRYLHGYGRRPHLSTAVPTAATSSSPP